MTRSNVRTQGWHKYGITIAFGSFAADGVGDQEESTKDT